MKNPIRIRTNTENSSYFDVYLYGDRKTFESDEDELMRQDDLDVMFAGPSTDLIEQKGKVYVGGRVSYRMDGKLDEVKFGTIVSTKPTPYYEIEEHLTKNRVSVHTKYVKSAEPTLEELADMYIYKFSEHNYRKYDLGAVKIREKTFMTAVESLLELSSKGMFIIMIRVAQEGWAMGHS